MIATKLSSLVGEYQDRRDGSKVNCSKTIWILATNALDPLIKDFCSHHPDILGDDEAKKQKVAKELSKELKQGFLAQFGVGPLNIDRSQG